MQRPNLSNVPILRSNVPPPLPPYNADDYPDLTSPNNEYSTLESAVQTVPPSNARRPPMPLPTQQSTYGNIGANRGGIPVNLSTTQYMNTGGRRLTRRKSTRRHCKTKYRRRQNKKKSKKRKY